MSDYNLNERFTYRRPIGDQPQRYERIRGMALEFAEYLIGVCPDSREFSLAITKLEECVMWANASIARNEREPD